MLDIKTLILGPFQTNCYLLCDTKSKAAVVIDPAADGEKIIKAAAVDGATIEEIWFTHAHFDHLGGLEYVCSQVAPPPKIALHADDLPLWENQGGAPLFGLHAEISYRPEIWLTQGQKMAVGEFEFEVRHTPGHTPGHVVYYCPTEGVLFCGDVIFQGSIGRTDLPGSDYNALITSIQTQILSLPDGTRLFPGHGPGTTVGEERLYNPFLS